MGNIFKGVFMPLDEQRKYLGKARLREGPYVCPMCGEMDKSSSHFLGDCKELRDSLGENFW